MAPTEADATEIAEYTVAEYIAFQNDADVAHLEAIMTEETLAQALENDRNIQPVYEEPDEYSYDGGLTYEITNIRFEQLAPDSLKFDAELDLSEYGSSIGLFNFSGDMVRDDGEWQLLDYFLSECRNSPELCEGAP